MEAAAARGAVAARTSRKRRNSALTSSPPPAGGEGSGRRGNEAAGSTQVGPAGTSAVLVATGTEADDAEASTSAASGHRSKRTTKQHDHHQQRPREARIRSNARDGSGDPAALDARSLADEDAKQTNKTQLQAEAEFLRRAKANDRRKVPSRHGGKRRHAREIGRESREHGGVEGKNDVEETDTRVQSRILGKSRSKKLVRAIVPSSEDGALQAHQAQLDLTKPLQAELEAVKAENARLQMQVNTYEGVISGQKSTISHFYGQCSCTICMELVWRPHVLVPCGHLFCAHCLIDWFQRPSPNDAPLPLHLSAEERRAELRSRTIRRTKVCPHCREKVSAPPAEVWAVKSLLDTIETSMAKGEGNEEHLVQGLGAEAGMSAEQRRKARGEDLPASNALWGDIFDTRPAAQSIIFDAEDGVDRCPLCASEVVHGTCTSCGSRYSDADNYTDSDFDDEIYDIEGLTEGEEDDWDDEDNSFIDDGPLEQDVEDDDDDDVEEVDEAGRPARPARRRLIASLSDSSDSGDESDVRLVEYRAHPVAGRGRRHRLDDEDDEEEALPSNDPIDSASSDIEAARYSDLDGGVDAMGEELSPGPGEDSDDPDDGVAIDDGDHVDDDAEYSEGVEVPVDEDGDEDEEGDFEGDGEDDEVGGDFDDDDEDGT